MKTFTDCIAIIENRMEDGEAFDSAFEKADVPGYLVNRIKDHFNPERVRIQDPFLLSDCPEKIELCSPLNKDDSRPYFSGFTKYLYNYRGWHREVVESIDCASQRILSLMPDPQQASSFQFRGLVVGHIQSGKTANMAALINKAADQGYRLFIVLAGIYNDLRAQTQDRLDQEITGFSDHLSQEALVVHDPGTPHWKRLTVSGLEGDFKAGTISWDPALDTPKLVVIKKNVSRMKQLTKWLQDSNVPLNQFPTLVIDDEADQASINLNYGETDDDGDTVDPSATNTCIREILDTFPKCVYTGYTATPYANVLIDKDILEDLYPRNFIAVLDEPRDYFGPRQLFGLGMPPSENSPETQEYPELDIIRPIEDDQLHELNVISDQYSCPEFLSTAITSFVLSSCARLARGQNNSHFSMLVHPSHTKVSHAEYKTIIEKEVALLKDVFKFPKKNSFNSVINKAKDLWESDFVSTTRQTNNELCPIMDFDEVWKHAKTVVNDIEIKTLNSDSEDKIDYQSGILRRYIVIGGHRLSRGLTLDGLSVSVFLRNSSNYDTLLQMGRWFGYRKGYQDLTRIFVTNTMADSFADLARVEDELREDLKQYTREDNPPTPLEIMPKIRVHPTLAITSNLKLGAGKRVSISLAHRRSETVSFPIGNLELLKKNLNNTGEWLNSLGEFSNQLREKSYVWADIDSKKILDLIETYNFSEDAQTVNKKILGSYIQKQNTHGEIISWDVILPYGAQKRGLHVWSKGISTHKVARSLLNTSRKNSIKVLSDPNDINTWRESLGRNIDDSSRGGLFIYLIDKASGHDRGIPIFENPQNGIDIVGLCFVFPGSNSNATVEYFSQG